MKKYQEVIDFIKSLYPNQTPVLLHAPVFVGKEKEYLANCIDSTFVSYVGRYVSEFEERTAAFTGSKYAVAVVNGTVALYVALKIIGVAHGDEVITQPLTFVATVNAISHCGAKPIFVDVDLDTMGMSPENLMDFLKNRCLMKDGVCINKISGKRIKSIIPMHTFGFPCRIQEIIEVAKKYEIPVIEDSAESIGSYYLGKHTGTFGIAGIISYNGNKIITTGGGGMIITDDEEFARKARHITTTGKIPHRWEYVHDTIAYNFRLANLNAALGVAQMELISEFIENKRDTAKQYRDFFKNTTFRFFDEPVNTKANFWLNTIILNDADERNLFLQFTNDNGVVTRPAWRLMNKLEMYNDCQTSNLENADWLEERIVNIPSSVKDKTWKK